MADPGSQTTAKLPRIDLLIVGRNQFLTSPARPGYRFPVKPAKEKDISCLVRAIERFQEELVNG